MVLFGRRLLPNDGYPNLASGTYVIPGTTAEVIRVQAPVDFAFVLVSGMLAWVFAFARRDRCGDGTGGPLSKASSVA